jgi:hypothetical protein
MYYAQNLQTVSIVAQRIDTALHVGTHIDGAMHATDGMGDTSGIQFFNASPDDDAWIYIMIFDKDGSPAPPTMDGPISQTLMPHQGYTLYAFGIPELPAGFSGSVQVDVSGDGLVGAVGNTVNYAVQGDGAFSDILGTVPVPANAPVPSYFIALPVAGDGQLRGVLGWRGPEPTACVAAYPAVAQLQRVPLVR